MNQKNAMDSDDLLTSLGSVIVKGTAGLIPHVGPYLAELLGELIPNQRLGRIAACYDHLSRCIGELDLEALQTMPSRLGLIEEALIAAGLTTQNDRIERIAYVLANGLSEEELKVDRTSWMLQTAKSLSEVDVIVLEYYTIYGRQRANHREAMVFRSKHPEIWLEAKSHPSVGNRSEVSQEELATHRAHMVNFNERRLELTMHEQYLQSLSLLESTNDPHSWHNIDPRSDIDAKARALDKRLNELVKAIKKREFRVTSLGLELRASMKWPKSENWWDD